jgi:putative SOS response-associated peptidase YedK
MCYFNGTKVTREEYIRLKHLEKLVANYKFFDNPLYIGPNYPQMPIIGRKKGEEDIEIVMKDWGFLPPFTATEADVVEFRSNFITLNAKFEHLFVNEDGRPSMYAEAAMRRRILIPSTHFFEWRHLYVRGKGGKILKQTVAVPYLIRLIESEIFYFPGIWNLNNLHGVTISLVTSPANEAMSLIHNTKKRMPTILTQDLAWEWLFNFKLSQLDVQSIGGYQYDAAKMAYHTVDKAFTTSPDPMKEVIHPGVGPLGDDVLQTAQTDLF